MSFNASLWLCGFIYRFCSASLDLQDFCAPKELPLGNLKDNEGKSMVAEHQILNHTSLPGGEAEGIGHRVLHIYSAYI